MSNKIKVGNINAKTVAIGPNAKIVNNEGNYIKIENDNSSFKCQNIVCDPEFKEEGFFPTKNPPLFSKFMGIKLGIGGAVSFISGLITISSWFYSLINHSDPSYIHKFVIAHSSSIFFLGIILLTAGLWLLRMYSDHSHTK
ncbi:MAG: hypothetical protein AB9861_04520 [Methanosarcina sp.]|jgi:hypothetical protein